MATWELGDQVTWIEVRVSPEGPERTRLEIEHIALEDERWREFGPALWAWAGTAAAYAGSEAS